MSASFGYVSLRLLTTLSLITASGMEGTALLDNADVTKQSKNENSPVPLGLKLLNCSPYFIGSSRSKLQMKLFTELISIRT